MKQEKQMSNIVRIGSCEETEIYEHAILVRMHPKVYTKFGCVIIQVISSRLEFAEVIISRWKWAGLTEVSRKKTELKVQGKTGGSYILPDAYEIVLKKIPSLELRDQEEWDE